MRVLVTSGSSTAEVAMVEAVVAGLRSAGADVTTAVLKPDGVRGLAVYRLVCVGVRPSGFWGRSLSSETEEALRTIRGLGGKHTAAFVCAGRLGGAGALRRLMALLEGEGAFIRDFDLLRSQSAGEAFGKRLTALLSS